MSAKLRTSSSDIVGSCLTHPVPHEYSPKISTDLKAHVSDRSNWNTLIRTWFPVGDQTVSTSESWRRKSRILSQTNENNQRRPQAKISKACAPAPFYPAVESLSIHASQWLKLAPPSELLIENSPFSYCEKTELRGKMWENPSPATLCNMS